MKKTCTIKTVWPDATALATAAAHIIVTESNKAVAEKGFFTMALSGGNTPKLLYEMLARPPFRENIPWKKTILAFGDERFVDRSDPDSNYKMVAAALLDHVPVLKKNILGIPTSGISPERSAVLYEQLVKKHVNARQPFDLVLLGIGEEGHTASVFPESPLISDTRHMVRAVWVAEKNMWRISFTLPFINRAKNVVFLVSGEAKAGIIKKIFSKSGRDLPASRIQPAGTLSWLLDEAAAASH